MPCNDSGLMPCNDPNDIMQRLSLSASQPLLPEPSGGLLAAAGGGDLHRPLHAATAATALRHVGNHGHTVAAKAADRTPLGMGPPSTKALSSANANAFIQPSSAAGIMEAMADARGDCPSGGGGETGAFVAEAGADCLLPEAPCVSCSGVGTGKQRMSEGSSSRVASVGGWGKETTPSVAGKAVTALR